VDDNRQLVHTFGDLGAYLRIPSGRMELDIIKMAKEEISIPLSTALQSAIRERTTVSYNDIAVTDTGGNSHAITLTVRTIVNHEAPRFAVLFEQESELAER
jgi:two-component system CheB/CheR fusion protein